MFRFNENADVAIADAFGNVADVTLAGTTTNSLTANPGWVTPPDDGAGNLTNITDAYLTALMDVGTYEQIIVAFDLWHTGAPSTAEGIIGRGNVAGSGPNYGWGLVFLTSESLLAVNRGPGSSGQGTQAIGGTSFTGYRNRRNPILLEMLSYDETWSCNVYHDGAQIGSVADAAYGTGGRRPAPGEFADNGMIILGRPQTAGGDKPLGDGASGARMDNLIITSRVTRDVNLAPAMADEIWKHPGEIPVSALS
ncbi:MAG: hypothetical protein U5L11_02445 [Arhodomonas sp.]|nr:hypothetical protein [Arhodomonas sp.]